MICKGTLASGKPHPRAPYMSGTYPGPRELDVKQLQRTLLDQGSYLGNLGRLKELNLV